MNFWSFRFFIIVFQRFKSWGAVGSFNFEREFLLGEARFGSLNAVLILGFYLNFYLYILRQFLGEWKGGLGFYFILFYFWILFFVLRGLDKGWICLDFILFGKGCFCFVLGFYFDFCFCGGVVFISLFIFVLGESGG